MADENELLEINLDDPVEKKATDTKAVTTPETTPVVTAGPTQEAFEALKKQLEEEKAGRDADRSARQQAEARARKAAEESNRSQQDTRSANMTLVTNAIDAVKREQEILEANYANAMGGGDFTQAAKIQSAMSTNAARLVQLETGKSAMEDEAKAIQERTKSAPTQDRQSDPVEALASQLSPRSAAWVRAHPEYARDQRLMRKMVAAHNLVIDEAEADSDAYFEKVESILGITKSSDGGESALSEASGGTQRKSAPAAAPVTRSGTGDGKRQNTVTLTAQEREIAEMNGMTPREYAEQKAKLIKEGRMN